MGWIESINEAIEYIEENLEQDLSIEKIAKHACISPFYFQKGFAMLCGLTVGEYIRKRRLSLAGSCLLHSEEKMIDIALKYGYDSPDSFTKAFVRFHGVTPTAVRKEGAMVKSYAPLKLKIEWKGGYTMDYRIVEKESFKVMGVSKVLKYEEANTECPKFWAEQHVANQERKVCGMYGISYDEKMQGDAFKYMIADDFEEEKAKQKKLEIFEIPKYTWAIFPCIGGMPEVFQKIHHQIFSEWLPENNYEIAAGYNIEMYSDPKDYPNGVQDAKYYSEIWIPVKKK